MYLFLKNTHTVLAVLSIAGFLLRGLWMWQGSRLLGLRLTKIAPHVVDTLFLATGIALVVAIRLNVLQHPWLLAKIIGLIIYIALGMIALRFGRTSQVRLLAFVAAVATYAYIVGAALTKSPASWLAFTAT